MAPAEQYEARPYAEVAASLPVVTKDAFERPPSGSKMLIVLDDDPTGTQTVHDVAVLTTFEKEVLRSEVRKRSSGFFILTNSRAFTSVEDRHKQCPTIQGYHC